MNSDSEQFVVPLLQSDGTYLMSTVDLTELESGDYVLVLTWDDGQLEATSEDCFDAFCSVRRGLEPLDLLPACYGAHLHAFPSGMSRSMGGGRKLYRLTLGKQALAKDLVQLFDAGEDVVPSTVENQRRFFDEWIGSLGSD